MPVRANATLLLAGALLVAGTTPAQAQQAVSGKSLAVMDGDFDPSAGCLADVPIGTIQKGKKNSILTVHLTASSIKNGSVPRIFSPEVNGYAIAGPSSIDGPAQSQYDNTSVSGVWWLDLDQAEASHPGEFVGKPLAILIDQLCNASGGGGFHVTAVARMSKK